MKRELQRLRKEAIERKLQRKELKQKRAAEEMLRRQEEEEQRYLQLKEEANRDKLLTKNNLFKAEQKRADIR